MKPAQSLALCGFVLALSSSTIPARAAPGFGTIRKKNLELQTRQPARVRLAHTTIAFRGSSTNREYAPVEASLLATLETEIVGNEKSLVKKERSAEAEWVLELKITGYSIPNAQNRSTGSGNNAANAVRWTGSLNVAYQVLDHAGRSHDSKNVSYNYDKEFSSGGSIFTKLPTSLPGKKHAAEPAPHSPEDVKQILVREVVHQIAANLGNTTKTLEVQVATGEDHLNLAAEFLDKRLWQRAIDELQGAPAFAKPEDESYRQYDLGLAYESMAYDSKTSEEQRANMYKAAELYDKALELHPKEKYFVASVARTKDAIARYQELDQMQKEDKQRVTGRTTKPKLKLLRVGDVVNMFTAGVPPDSIIETIRDSPLEFEPRDVDTQIAIAKAKLPVSIQNEMRKKVGLPPLAASKKQ